MGKTFSADGPWKSLEAPTIGAQTLMIAAYVLPVNATRRALSSSLMPALDFGRWGAMLAFKAKPTLCCRGPSSDFGLSSRVFCDLALVRRFCSTEDGDVNAVSEVLEP